MLLEALKPLDTFGTIEKRQIRVVQINLGNVCNQRCLHCHIDASPEGGKRMDVKTAHLILNKLIEIQPERVEFTGGAPEMNPTLPYFIKNLSTNDIPVTVRTNLTVLDRKEYAHLLELYKNHKVKLIASLPSPFREETDKQRGMGVFDTSIKVLKELNKMGYGKELELDLVHNPVELNLPQIEQIEEGYKKILHDRYGLAFNKLITIINSPVGRFKKRLESESKYNTYMKLLINNFNSKTLEHLMCRELITVDHEGYIYDCDFNLALGIRIRGFEDKRFYEIDFKNFTAEISIDKHCYACTADCGSSCNGILVDRRSDEYCENHSTNGTSDPYSIVEKYYSELEGSYDLKTNVCCSLDMPPNIKDVLPLIADEIKQRYYGCGSPIPLALEGLKVLDIGCGTGRDCYILSRLVGKKGLVYGIDMTEDQINIAKKYLDEQTRVFGYEKPNVRFIHDYIENITNHIPPDSLDLVVSNCVFNLISNKEDVLKKIYLLLKEGGEFYFSDIYSDRRIPGELKSHPVLYSECLGGALYYRDFERLAKKTGFLDPRVVTKRPIEIKDKEIEDLVGNIRFYSITYRLVKLEELEEGCEDYGHIAIYKGGITYSSHSFILDEIHVFEKDKPERICGNTAIMLTKTRFKEYFTVIGSFEKHFGAFKVNNLQIQFTKGDDHKENCC